MTVGLYINEPAAIMISDCLALPSAGGMQLYSPSNIEIYDGTNGELATLVSKFIQADENTIIAFAGRDDHIMDFVKNFPDYWQRGWVNCGPSPAPPALAGNQTPAQ